jgi:hypothetical protein
MTGLALGAGLEMRTVTERNVARNLVNADPIYIPFLPGECFEFTALRVFRLNCRVALHAPAYLWHVHHFTRIGIGMAHFAAHFQISHVQLVVKSNRLRGTRRLALLPGQQNCKCKKQAR